MREMTKAGMDTWPRDDVEEDSRIDENKWNIKDRLRSKRNGDYKSSKESQYLMEDTLGTKHLEINDLSLCNGKIVFPQNGTAKPIISRPSTVENLNTPRRVPSRNSKGRRSTNTLSKSRRRALTMNAANSWEIKYDPILKAEALRNAKNIKVSLTKLHDRNANVVSVCDKFKRSRINNLKQETEDKYVSSINLRADSNHGLCGWNTSTVSNSNKYDPCTNFKTCKDRRKNNESTDIEYFENKLKRLSTTITLVHKRIDTPRNGTPKAQISDTKGNQNLKEKSTVLEANEKRDLLLKKEAKDSDSVLNRIPCENVGKTKKLAIVTETTVLPTNVIKISDAEGTDSFSSKISIKNSPEFKISQSKSHSTYTEIDMAELLNIVDDNVFKKSTETTEDNSVVHVKDSVEKNFENAKANNNKKNSSTVKTTACKDKFSTKVSDEDYNVKFSSKYPSIRDNKTNALPTQVLPPEDCTTDTTVNTNKCSNNATRMNTESSLSSNNALKRRAERGVVDKQQILHRKEKTEKINTTAEDLYKKVNLSKNNRANSNQSIGNEGTKRIKLDRSVCLKSFGRKRENADIVASSTAGTVPGMAIASSSKSTIVGHVPETKSKNEEDILNLFEEKASTSFASTNKKDSDSLQNVWKASKITSETPKSPAKDKFVVAGKTDCDSETATDDEDTDPDCISLYADSTLMEEYDSPVISTQPNSHKMLVRSEKPYAMTDKVFNNYYESTTSEFNTAYDNINANNDQNTTPKVDRVPVLLRLGLPVIKELPPLMPRVHQNPQNCGITNIARPDFPKCFRGYCYRYIRFGNCSVDACNFKHNFLPLITKLYGSGDLFEVIDTLVLMGFLSFITIIYEQLVTQLYGNTTFVLKVLKRLYELTVATVKTAERTFVVWERLNIPMEVVVNNLTRIVDHNDSNFVNWIVKILQNHIIHHLCHGTYWNTLKALLLKVPNLEAEIITVIVRECVTTRKNVLDVHKNVVIKLDNNVRSAVDQRLWLRFNNLLKCTRENNTIKESLSTQSDIHIRSPDVQNPVYVTESPLTTSQHSVTIPRKVWRECVPKMNERDDNNNTQNQSTVLQPIDDLPEPHSPHGRRIFCKFYLDVQSLQEGLKRDDYDHVMRILNAAKQTDKTVFSRECYKILCKEVKCSQSRLSKLISFAVQIGATPVVYEILLDVAIRILARLAEMEHWVLALKLLEDVDVMIKMRIRLQEIDAVTLLLLAEIYLANDQPVKAFTLLKQTNIISSNRSKWETPSNPMDDCIRAQVVALLLDRLCEMSPHHAIFLLEFLVNDQYSNFSPVDLTRSVNKIVPVILLEGDHESIINIGKLIDNYSFTLNTITHRALAAALVHIDKDLAMQFYQNAIGFGIYSNIRFHPATYIIIHSDWTNEEIYLVILDLMQQLSSNIGHAIDRISLKHLSIYVHFETTPSETQLACDRRADKQKNDNRIIETKKRMAAVLEKQFEPPILLAKSRNNASNICKLQNTSVRRYLQSEHPRFIS